MSYFTVSDDDVLNTTNNENTFPELKRAFKENFELKVQEGSVLKYLHFRIFQSPLGFRIDQTDRIMQLVNEWFPTRKCINIDTPFRTDSSYEKGLLAALPLTGHALQKEEMEYHGKFGETFGRIQHIALMSRIDLCYAICSLATQTVSPTLPSFQGIKRCVQYLSRRPHKHILYPSNYYDVSNGIILTWSGNQVEDHTTKNYLEFHQDADHARILNRRRSGSGIIHTLIGVSVCWKVHIQPAIAYESTDG